IILASVWRGRLRFALQDLCTTRLIAGLDPGSWWMHHSAILSAARRVWIGNALQLRGHVLVEGVDREIPLARRRQWRILAFLVSAAQLHEGLPLAAQDIQQGHPKAIDIGLGGDGLALEPLWSEVSPGSLRGGDAHRFFSHHPRQPKVGHLWPELSSSSTFCGLISQWMMRSPHFSWRLRRSLARRRMRTRPRGGGLENRLA
ncbi:uncharacterized protein LOC112341837, partial [Selaginella moellendorffii]|uniref:uncharacterized protein LOC112341837 n=1 Tax=Selaginella moellendorffii TaxID=88036 RepID=UPI000D1C68E8